MGKAKILFAVLTLLGFLAVCSSLTYHFVFFLPAIEQKKEAAKQQQRRAYDECLAGLVKRDASKLDDCDRRTDSIIKMSRDYGVEMGPMERGETFSKCVENTGIGLKELKDECYQKYWVK